MANIINIFDDEKVAVSPIIIARDKIENLTDRPNTNKEFGGDGMTGDSLKKAFDKIGIYVATRLKNLTETLKSGDAGCSIGIKGWNEEVTTIKGMLMELKATTGASKIGTGISVGGSRQDLQSVLDNLYALISSYELDDIYDIKLDLQYDKATGACIKLDSMTANLNLLNDYVEKLQNLLTVNDEGTSAIRIDNIESDVLDLIQSQNSPLGIATLNGVGKLANELDASKITSGKLPLSCIPDSAFERVFEVASEAERFKLTIVQVQNGDIVIVTGNPDKWFKVIDETKLSAAAGYREIIGGTTATAQMAREFDANYIGANSIVEKLNNLAGVGRNSETIKKNADDIALNKSGIATNLASLNAMKGVGWVDETIKNNATEIAKLKDIKNVFFTNVTIQTTQFISSTTYEDYKFSCSIPLANVTSTQIAEVFFSHNEAVSSNFSPIAETYDGGIKLYSIEVPDSNVVIPKIIIIKEG